MFPSIPSFYVSTEMTLNFDNNGVPLNGQILKRVQFPEVRFQTLSLVLQRAISDSWNPKVFKLKNVAV